MRPLDVPSDCELRPAVYDPGPLADAANWLAGPSGTRGETQWYRLARSHNPTSIEGLSCGEAVPFNSYSYLGLSSHPAVRDAAQKAIREYGTSACGVRPVSGTRDLHIQLEAEIADWLGKEDAFIFSTGYGTNESTIAALFGPEDVIVSDRYAHRSMRKGFELSRSKTVFFEHNDLIDLEAKLEQHARQGRNTLVCIEGVYSMHGSIPDLARVAELTRRHGCLLYVDEAHSIGALGTHGGGICEYRNVDPDRVFMLMGSLSKAIPSIGGYVAADRESINFLRFTSSQSIFSAAGTPADTAAALAAIRVIRSEPQHGQKLRNNIRYLSGKLHEAGFEVASENGSPVIPLIFQGGNREAFEFWRNCLANGIALNTFYFPVVPKGSFLARVGVMATHEEHHMDRLVEVLKKVGQQFGAPS